MEAASRKESDVAIVGKRLSPLTLSHTVTQVRRFIIIIVVVVVVTTSVRGVLHKSKEWPWVWGPAWRPGILVHLVRFQGFCL